MDDPQPTKRRFQFRLPYIFVMTAMAALFFAGWRIGQQLYTETGGLFEAVRMTPHLTNVLFAYLPIVVFATALFFGGRQSQRYAAATLALGVVLFAGAELSGVTRRAGWTFLHGGVQLCALAAATVVVARSFWARITIAWCMFGAVTFLLAGFQTYVVHMVYAAQRS